MEITGRVGRTSLLFEARHRMRVHVSLENFLLDMTDLLPPDRYGAEPRECFQLGAAQAFVAAGEDASFCVENIDTVSDPFETLDTLEIEKIIQAFCATRPYNKYSGEYYYDPSELDAFVRAYHLVSQAVHQLC